MDASRASAAARVIFHPFALALILFATGPQNAAAASAWRPSNGSCSAELAFVKHDGLREPPSKRLREIQALYSANRFDEVVCLTSPQPRDPPDIDYYRGMALTKLRRWGDAERAFERGRQKAPKDKRFPTELAGIAFLQKRYGAAKKNLTQVMRLDPADVYANNFIATIFSLENNLPAALKYWNRIEMPKVESLVIAPPPRVDPVLLARAFTFSPGSVLTVPEFCTTQARLNSLGIFLSPRLELVPASGGQFAAHFTPAERNGMGGTKLAGLVSALRGVPYETIYPEWINLHGAAINFTSLLRWDPNKERVFLSLSGPFGENPRWRYGFYLDGRRENWNVSDTFLGAAAPVTDMQLEKIEGAGEIENVVSGRLQWNAGLSLSGRTFRKVRWSDPAAAAFFRNGFALAYRSNLDATLFDVQERRLTVTSSVAVQAGRLFSRNASSFVQTEAGALTRWFPRAQGNDYEMATRVRAGKTWGGVPFDDLFILGLERDNDLWLRAHVGTTGGRKGSAPLGRNYALINWDDAKDIYHNGFVNLKLGPFLDSGTIADPSRDFGSHGWLLDAGIEIKIQLLGGATVEVVLGKDLRTGRNAYYGTTQDEGIVHRK